MDAVFLFFILVAGVIVADLLAVTIGTDSRDGFAEDGRRTGLR
jgi:hypothetical protein